MILAGVRPPVPAELADVAPWILLAVMGIVAAYFVIGWLAKK